MKAALLFAFLITMPVFAFADYDVTLILAQKNKIEAEINKRNKLLDDIGIPRNPMFTDALTLSNINLNELSVEYELDALSSFLLMLNNVEK